jgi:hypothetical protein
LLHKLATVISVQIRGSKRELSFLQISDGIERCAEQCFGFWSSSLMEISQSDSSSMYNMQLTMTDAAVI